MRLKSAISCIYFTESTLDIAVVNLTDGAERSRLTIPYSFQGLDTTGAIRDPQQMRSFLEGIIVKHDLPTKIGVGIGLKYLDLRRLTLPSMPLDELVQIITDEATRESIFSFSGDPLAVSYRIIGNYRSPSGIDHYEILAATVPQEVITGYLTACNTGPLQLVFLKPLLDGFHETFCQKLANLHDGPVALVKLSGDGAEFFIWEQDRLLFWRPLMVGSNSPERLQNEIINSIEHFKRRSTGPCFIKKIYLTGAAISLSFDGLDAEYVSDERADDLLGLGLGLKTHGRSDFDFLVKNPPLREKPFLQRNFTVLVLLLLILTGCNGWLIYRVRHDWSELRTVENQLAQTEFALANYRKAPAGGPGQSAVADAGLNSYLFLDDLRQIVPSNLRFERIDLNNGTHELSLEGYCIGEESLNYFLERLPYLKDVKNVTMIETNRQDAATPKWRSFKLSVQMGAGFSGNK